MRQALLQAEEARQDGEVPVGCVIVHNGEIIARGRNRREEKQSTLSHAETEAIAQANAVLHSWRLEDCTLYVTLEPCPMCAGAIINARVARVVYGAKDARAGAFGSVLQMNGYPLNHKPQLVGGVCEEECRALMTDFFARLREKRLEGKLRRRKCDFMK